MLQLRCQQAHRLERPAGLVRQLARPRDGTLDAEHGGIRDLSERGVTAGGFAELLRGRGGVEHIVGDLEGQPDGLPLPIERWRMRAARAGCRGANAH